MPRPVWTANLLLNASYVAGMIGVCHLAEVLLVEMRS
jgi:hypothetical protein